MKIAVLGAGAWGTALARLLHQGKMEVTLWGHDPEHLRDLQEAGRNDRYLPGVELPSGIQLQTDPARAVADAAFVVVAVPDRKSTRLNSSHIPLSRMPSSA